MSKVATILDEILAVKRTEIAASRAAVSEQELQARASVMAPPRPFAAALGGAGVAVIAEIKRGSPSAGLFAPDLDAAETARAFARAGAAAISVLTDVAFFHGSPDDLKAARLAAPIPALRKEFIISEYQVFESRAMGADAILLIAAAVDDIERLIAAARAVGLDCVVEIHDESELEMALAAGPDVIGINNRDLRTFATDLNVTRRLRPRIPPGILVVSESGIRGPEHVSMVKDWGVDAILVGESVITAPDPEEAVRALVEAGRA